MLKLIKTDQDYQEAMAAVSVLMAIPEAKMTDEQGDELEVRALLIERYEDTAFPIIATDAINAIELVMETEGLTRSDLEVEFGGKGAMSEVLNRHRALSKVMIQRLHERLRIPLDILLEPHPLRTRGFEAAGVVSDLRMMGVAHVIEEQVMLRTSDVPQKETVLHPETEVCGETERFDELHLGQGVRGKS